MNKNQSPERSGSAEEENADSKSITGPIRQKISKAKQKPIALRKEDTQRAIGKKALKESQWVRSILVTEGDGKESRRQMELLLGGFIQSLNPKDSAELYLVETMAVSSWRKLHGYQFETGCLREGLDSFSLDRMLSDNYRFIEDTENFTGPEARHRLIRYPRGIEYVIQVLSQALTSLEKWGYIHKSFLDQIALLYGQGSWNLGGICNMCNEKDVKEAKANESEDAGFNFEAEMRKLVPSLLRKEISILKTTRKCQRDKSKLNAKAEFMRNKIPSAKDIERIRKHNGMANHDFYQAFEALRHLRADRLGKQPSLKT